MTNPLAGHTSAAGRGANAQGLRDGDGLTSPSLTNIYEALHGNGIMRLGDGARGDTLRNSLVPSTPGYIEVGSDTGVLKVYGGYCVIDGTMYKFAGGPTASEEITIGGANFSGDLPSVPSSTSDVFVVVYLVGKNTPDAHVKYEMGTPAAPSSGTPLIPNRFLSSPSTTGQTDANHQHTVIAVVRYTMAGGAANVTASLTTAPVIHDRRTFVRTSPLYLTPMTKGAIGNVAKTNAVTDLDTFFGSPEDGDLGGSTFGAIWQSHYEDTDGNKHANIYASIPRSLNSSPATKTYVIGPKRLETVTTTANLVFTFDQADLWIVTTNANRTINPSGPFGAGHVIQIHHTAGEHELRFDSNSFSSTGHSTNTKANVNVVHGEFASFVYNGTDWKQISSAQGSSGDITDVIAGTGMTGGATSGAATLNVIGGTGITANANDIAITAGGVGTTQLANSAVTSAKIADDAVTSAKIADGAVIAAAIGADAVTAAKIGNDVINSEHIANGAVDLVHMSVKSIDSDQYVDASIDTAHIGNNQITNALMADNAIDTAELATSAVETAKINNAAVTADKLASNAVTTVKINADAVTNAKIANDAVDTENIADDAITAALIDDGAVGTAAIANSNVTLAKLANIADDRVLGNISGSAAAPAELTAANLRTLLTVADGSLTTNDFTNADHSKLNGIAASANNYVHPDHSGEVTSNADGATTIATGAVVADRIAADAVTTVKILNANVTTAKIAADAVTSAKIADDAVDTEHIAADAIEEEQIGAGEVKTAAIGDEQVTLAKMANIADDTMLGNISGSAAAPAAMSIANVHTLIGEATGSITGLMSTAHHDKLDGITASAVSAEEAIAAVEGEGTLDLTGVVKITTSGTDEVLRLESTDSDGAVAPVMTFKRTSTTPADGDNIGIIQFLGTNSDQDDGAGTEAEHQFADIYARMNDITATEEDGEIYFRTLSGGALKRRLDINALGVVFNEESLDMNFRVESNGNANMLTVDGGTNRVGIGVLSPTATLDVVGDVRFRAPVESIATDPAPAIAESGTVYYLAPTGTIAFTLPSSPTVGTQFVVVNKTGLDINITPDGSSKVNGGANGVVVTNTTAWAATTVVCVAANQWAAFGGI